MPDGPPLLKERRYLRKEDADRFWKALRSATQRTGLGSSCGSLISLLKSALTMDCQRWQSSERSS